MVDTGPVHTSLKKVDMGIVNDVQKGKHDHSLQ